MVEGPSRRSGSCRETLPEVRKWSGSLPVVRKLSWDPLEGPEVVGEHPRGVEVVVVPPGGP